MYVHLYVLCIYIKKNQLIISLRVKVTVINRKIVLKKKLTKNKKLLVASRVGVRDDEYSLK